MTKRIVFAVTNDLSFDQRMHRICSALQADGFAVLLIGRKRKRSIPLQYRSFQQHRISCWFDKGKLFYLEYNLRLFLYLLRTRADIYGAVDLDAALPMYWHAKRSKKAWTFDAHEYFSELEEVVTRPIVHRVWSWVEAFIVRRAQHAYTISESYAKRFKSQYGTSFEVIRNVPRKQKSKEPEQKKDSSIPVVIYQGALNVGRGLEESIEAMRSIESAVLHIYGDGPIKEQLIEKISALNLKNRVYLKGTRIPEALRSITPNAHIGLTLFSSTGFHHKHSLANRFFDYIHAGIPQVCMAYSEYHNFNQAFEVAVEIESLKPNLIANAIKGLLSNNEAYNRLKAQAARAADEHHWEKESEKLIQLYRSL